MPVGEYDLNPPVILPKKKQTTLSNQRRRNNIKIGTYNVRSLATRHRYLELINALENINIDILGLSETRVLGCRIEEHPSYIFCYIGQTKGMYGVGFLVKKIWKKNITNFIGLSERVALLQMKFENQNISIIQGYSPTEKSSDIEIETFYSDLKKAHTLAGNNVIVLGDFNAKIGQPRKEEKLIMGPYGLGQRSERGERLIEYACENGLAIVNSYYKKKPSRRWTWISPDERTKNEIDYVLTNTLNRIQNYEVLNNVKFRTDHRLLRVTLNLNQIKKSRKHFKTQPKIPRTEEEIKRYLEALKLHIGNKLENIRSVQSYYNTLEGAITDSLNYTNNCNENKRHRIFSEETIKLINKRSELAMKKNKDTNMKKELSKLYKETSKAIKRDYREHRQRVITDNLNKYRSTKRAFKILNVHRTWIQKLQDKEETKSRQEVIQHATTFYQKLYKNREDNTKNGGEIYYSNNTEIVSPIELKETQLQLKNLKPNKSPGPDGITNEALKLGAPVLLNPLTELFNLILETELVPRQWCTSDIILLHKKGNPLDINNYRPISLMANTYKIFATLILNRISKEIDKAQPAEQAGFRSGFSTLDHIQALEQVIEKYEEFNRPLYLSFIDYSKAFDSISHTSIWQSLNRLNINPKYTNIIKHIYNNSTSNVRLESRGKTINIERGVRQGDPLSPKLFIAVLENIFQSLDWKTRGIKINNNYLSHLRFADDIVLLAESANDLQDMLCSLDNASSIIGLEMNATKTKILTNSFKKPISVNKITIEYTDSYIYLGKQISFSKFQNDKEVERRSNLAWTKFWSLKEILKGDYSINLKKIVLDTCVLPSLLYGCPTWIFTTKTKQKITTTQRAMERSILNIRKIHKIRSETIRQKTKLTDGLTQALKLKWQWAGHIARYTDNRWTLQTTAWKGPTGKRRVGRPKRRWADDIIEVAGSQWLTIGKKREKWKKLEEAFTQGGVHFQK